MDTLRKRLRERREAKGFSQAELANLIKCKQEKISGYESGRVSPRLDTLMKLADALDAPTDYLLGRSDEIKRRVTLEDVLSPDEIDLILHFRSLPHKKQMKLIGIAIGYKE